MNRDFVWAVAPPRLIVPCSRRELQTGTASMLAKCGGMHAHLPDRHRTRECLARSPAVKVSNQDPACVRSKPWRWAVWVKGLQDGQVLHTSLPRLQSIRVQISRSCHPVALINQSKSTAEGLIGLNMEWAVGFP